MKATERDTSGLDPFLPEPDFSERHACRIRAEPSEVWAVLSTLSLADLPLARPLMALRHLGRRSSTLNQPLFTSGPLTPLLIQPPGQAVAGAISRPWRLVPDRHHITSMEDFIAFDLPGWTKYLTEFAITPTLDGCLLTTETRGRSTDPLARRRFGFYWIMIRPFSGLIRRSMLAAIRRGAEGNHPSLRPGYVPPHSTEGPSHVRP